MFVKLSENIFLLFVFLLPWQTMWIMREVFIDGEKWEFGTIGIYASTVLCIAALVLIFVGRWQRVCDCVRAISTPLKVMWSVLFLWLAMGVFQAPDHVLAATKFIFLALAVSVPLMMHVLSIAGPRIVFILLASLSLHAMLGLWQFMTQSDFASTLLGLSYHDAWRGGISVIETSSGRWLRAYGGFTHPNMFGGVMAGATILAVGMWLRERVNHMGRWYFSLMILFYSAMLISFSKGALIGFFIGLFFILIVLHRDIMRWHAWASLSVALLSISLVVIISYSDLWQTRAAGETRLEQMSRTERVSQVAQSRSIITQHLAFGVGLGNYTKMLAQGDTQIPVWQHQPVHNVALLILAETGLGFLLVMGLLIVGIKKIWDTRATHSVLEVVSYGSLIALGISGLFDHWQWSSHFGVLFIALLGGLLLCSVDEKITLKLEKKS